MSGSRSVVERVSWQMKTQLERPSNYDRRITVPADDLQELLDAVKAVQS